MHPADFPKYTLRGYTAEPGSEKHKGCDCELGADTIREAKKRARYWLTEEYMHCVESTQMIVLVEIFRGDDLICEIRPR